NRSRIAITELQDSHQAARQFRLALGGVQHAKRRIEFDISPCLRKGGAQNLRFGGIENASLQFERTHGFRSGNGLTTHVVPNDDFCRRGLGGYQETHPCYPRPPNNDIRYYPNKSWCHLGHSQFL